jgi:hypothetical protein
MYYRLSENRFEAGRPSAVCCQKFILGTFLNLGCTLFTLFYTPPNWISYGPALHESTCARIFSR